MYLSRYDERARYGNRDLGLFSEAFTLSVVFVAAWRNIKFSSWIAKFLVGSGDRTVSIVGGHWIKRDHGYLPFTRENRKFQLENQMVHAIPFGKLQKIWAVI